MNRWQFWIDVGGTFTDCVGLSPTGQVFEWKALSSGAVKGTVESQPDPGSIVDPHRIGDHPHFWSDWTIEFSDGTAKRHSLQVLDSTPAGQLRLSESVSESLVGVNYELRSAEPAPILCIRQLLRVPLGQRLPGVDVRLGTTRGTNALLERKGAATGFLVTRGFADLLRIGNQDRPDLFALNIRKQEPLHDHVVEIVERLSATGEVLIPLDEELARQQLEQLRRQGIESIAICLLHAYLNPAHEHRLLELAREAGFTSISVSSQVAPVIKAVPRAETTVLDAYLNPVLQAYIASLQQSLGPDSTLRLMGSQGGLIPGNQFSGKDSILSGPAGGVIAYSRIAQAAGFDQAIGFDMGGTSTDVSRFGGAYELETESVKAGVRIATPLLAIETVAAGGGSLCQFDGVLLRVGPESAGADPGPACYGRGGPLTITDVNLMLGRILPDHFPFHLDRAAVESRIDEILHQMKASGFSAEYTPEQLAQGFVEIANETMARAIRTISVRKGYDPAEHLLVCFGGAGAQHACALARILGIRSILIHPLSGLLSAYGMGLADVRRRAERQMLRPLTDDQLQELPVRFEALAEELQEEVRHAGVGPENIDPPHRGLRLRYQGVDASLVIPEPVGSSWTASEYRAAFEQQHQQLFGYIQPHRPLEIVTIVVDVVGHLPSSTLPEIPRATADLLSAESREVWFQGERVQTPVYLRQDLRSGHQISGPALLCETGSTVWIEPGFQCHVLASGELIIHDSDARANPAEVQQDIALEAAPDPVTLEIFNNQFASIAEQMGVTLRRTSISTNVKERLDYSCALFDASGGLVVNAPHIPVHLGAMGETVSCLLRDNPDLRPGDVLVTNDPYSGGSHLPDLTVVTPVHDDATGELLFFTASRAHHAEIGGMTPGSMPPFSRSLGEEGVLIRNFKIVEQGTTRFDEFRTLLTSGPWPSRSPDDNLADVTAQIAANQVGATLLKDLLRRSGRERVLLYMGFIQQAAEIKMRRALSAIPDGVFERTDFLDDGSPIAVRIEVTGDSAVIDFTGTGPVRSTNLNANRAIVTAAVMYVFRCMIEESIPLNCGVLRPLRIVLPECLLNPPALEDRSRCAAMVGGNVETSQRVVDVLLGALGLAAASQGTMNNLTFGDGTFGFYETICGGAGATPQADGADAVHTHMTNTRLTDVEIIESRYPVRIEEFSIRRGSGGPGKHRGGDGIRRVFVFLKPLTVSLLTQRRGSFPPFGLQKGSPGLIGRNQKIRFNEGIREELPGATQLQMQFGDQLIIETPGGGGYGMAEES